MWLGAYYTKVNATTTEARLAPGSCTVQYNNSTCVCTALYRVAVIFYNDPMCTVLGPCVHGSITNSIWRPQSLENLQGAQAFFRDTLWFSGDLSFKQSKLTLSSKVRPYFKVNHPKIACLYSLLISLKGRFYSKRIIYKKLNVDYWYYRLLLFCSHFSWSSGSSFRIYLTYPCAVIRNLVCCNSPYCVLSVPILCAVNPHHVL